MSSINILERIQPIFKDIFDDETIVVTAETTAADVEDWDSFAQMQIVMGVEAMFGIKFSTDEVTAFKCVGDVEKAVKRHIG
ncbi:MAG: acyl carrier protein [Hungatella sp.]|jgi:acyl carrier protein|nr:acyl carrier protein [Hungatella sp.]